jgi:hydrogenase maturation protein HypF
VRVLACGAYLKNAACLIEDRRVLWSAPHGDLGETENRIALDASVSALLAAASGPVQAIAHDLHPDYYSTRVALELAHRLGVPAVAVQHHHAHIAVVQAEQAIEGPVIGLALDGMGLGTDGTLWGGEILWVSQAGLTHNWRRLAHLASLAMPGGDTAAREPWRLAAAVLHGMGRTQEIEARFGSAVGRAATRLVASQLLRGFNCPGSTSAGRWFDAAAGALGLCLRQNFEAEAAMALERHAHAWLEGRGDFAVQWPSLDLAPLLAGFFAMGNQGNQGQARGAALFHLALADSLARGAMEAACAHGASTVVLAGGCCLNGLLVDGLSGKLRRYGLGVALPQSVGCGDRGLALGQAWVAACSLRAGAAPGVSMEI